jgi:trypsin
LAAGHRISIGVRGLLLALTAGLLAALAVAAPSADAAAGSVRVGDGLFLTKASKLETSDSRVAVRGKRSEPRIVGGEPTSINRWPWQAAITANPAYYSGNAMDRQFCGGSLLTPNLVLTAAHCVFDDDTWQFLNASHFAAVTGRTQLSAFDGQESALATYYVITNGSGTPLFSPVTYRWDVVILKLASTSAAIPIKIAGADEKALWAGGRDAFATGWGATSEGGPQSDVLRSVGVSMTDDGACSQAYPGEIQTDVMACAGVPAGGRDTCQGDSGGPLVSPTSTGAFRLVGVTSWGYGCARAGQPGVYARVADDTMRNTLRNGVLGIEGVDVVGSGAAPPAPPAPPVPPSSPTAPTAPTAPPAPTVNCYSYNLAIDNAENALRDAKNALRNAKSKPKKKRAKKRVAAAKQALIRAQATAAAAGC